MQQLVCVYVVLAQADKTDTRQANSEIGATLFRVMAVAYECVHNLSLR